jgi:hypothetical protein
VLPPNNANHDGEGYVFFYGSGEIVSADAHESGKRRHDFFDDNEPMVSHTTANLLVADIPTSG